jgi:D-tyrosyl-tRNA(Tyr) deacylase
LRALIQRVREASVRVDGQIVGAIGGGLLVLAGIAADDGDADRDWLVRKIVALRIFDDAAGVMNRSVADVGGEILAVSQFTLHAATRKGNRPSWSGAAPPEVAQPRFDAFVAALAEALGKPVPTGVFGAMMQVALVNDGPVTIWLDSRQRE